MDLIIYIIAAVGFLILLLVMLVVMLIPKFRGMIKDKLVKFKEKLIWNGVIRSIMIAYLGSLMTVGVQVKMMLKGSEYQTEKDKAVALGMLLVLVAIPVFMIIFLNKKRSVLQDIQTKLKWVNMYQNVHLKRNRFTIYFTPIFLFRRILFVALPILFYNYSYF